MLTIPDLGLVLPGDVWFYRPNYEYARKGEPAGNYLWVVVKVNKRKDEVTFDDGGWMPYTGFFVPDDRPGAISQELPVLIARQMTPKLLEKVIAKRDKLMNSALSLREQAKAHLDLISAEIKKVRRQLQLEEPSD